MIIALGGMFRNSAHYLPRYFSQVRELATLLEAGGHALRPVLVEGDSVDNTWAGLAHFTNDMDAVLVKRSHGGGPWGSVDDPARWKALSWVCQGVLDHVTKDVGALVYVETDLVWEPATMLALLQRLDDAHPAVAPMCFAGPNFYDIWGHRKNGVRFSPFPPYHPELAPSGLTQVDSVGSCIVMQGRVARAVTWGPDDNVLGLGRSIYENGYSLWVDPLLRVVHP